VKRIFRLCDDCSPQSYNVQEAFFIGWSKTTTRQLSCVCNRETYLE
jgi:hypothetical protein